MIHQSHPLDYIAFDRTMQDIVYKLVINELVKYKAVLTGAVVLRCRL